MKEKFYKLSSGLAAGVVIALMLFSAPLSLQAQCTYLNDQWLSSPAPTVEGERVELTTCLFGGEYREMTGLIAGNTYRFETCGDTDFDTQITIFPGGGGAAVAFNDDFCGAQSSVDFTPSATGTYDVQVNEFNCTTNSTCMTLWVTLVSGGGTACEDNEVVVDMFDSFGDGWNGNELEISDENDNVVATATITSGSTGSETFCLPDGCYSVTVDGGSFDSEVSWDISVNGNVELSGGAPEFDLELDINGGCGGDPPPADCEDNEFTLEIDFDFFASENSWEILDDNNNTVASGSGYSNGDPALSEPLCLEDGCYELYIYDSFGDGIFNSPDFTLLDGDNNVVASGEVASNGGLVASFDAGEGCGGGPPPAGDLPAPWMTVDVGGAECNAYDYDEGTAEFFISGCGNNAFPGSTSDNVAFGAQYLCGDVEIVAKVESVTPNGYGGLMMRDPESASGKQVSIFSNLTNVLRHESRAVAGAPKTVNSFYKPSPIWLKLTRQGSWVFAYYSTTGMNFQYVHAVWVPFGECVEVGMAAFTYNVGQVATATFSNVSVSGGFGEPTVEAPGIGAASMDRQQTTLFPNPAQSQVTIEFAPHATLPTYLNLRNELGQLVEQRQLEPDAFRTEWAVSDLANGVYFIEISRDGEVPQILRFVKTN